MHVNCPGTFTSLSPSLSLSNPLSLILLGGIHIQSRESDSYTYTIKINSDFKRKLFKDGSK